MRILIVDDQLDLAHLLAGVVPGHVEVVIASGVKSACRILEGKPFDLIVTDFHMLDGTGDMVCAKAREFHACPVYLHSSDPSRFGPRYDACFEKGEINLLRILRGLGAEKQAA